jgi:predicted O-methyltransferase YrrM
MRNIKGFIKKKFGISASDCQLIDYLQTNIRGFFPTYALTIDDDPYLPNKRLIDLSYKLLLRIQNIELRDISERFDSEMAKYICSFPGEHYRLLGAIVEELKPQIIIEIGTYTGASSLVMKKYLNNDCKLITYDITPWDQFANTGIRIEDFDEKLEQKIVDLTQKENYELELGLIQRADLIFIDAAKDGIMEKVLCDFFDETRFKKSPIIIFDDIKFLSMIKVWREIKHPKIDITSFGHWSGTGIVEWI